MPAIISAASLLSGWNDRDLELIPQRVYDIIIQIVLSLQFLFRRPNHFINWHAVLCCGVCKTVA